MEKEHYFDWAATSPADEDILKASLEETLECWGNPSSSHTVGKKARELFEGARARAAAALGVKPETIYFTSGGTESDQIPLLSVLAKPMKGTVLVSSIEHPAIREQSEALKNCGWKVVQIPADNDGVITPEAVTSLLTSDSVLVCIMAINNETGVIQPVYDIADAITKACEGKRRPKFHVDCVQAAGKITLNLGYRGIDSAALSSHKICGPRGIGILYMKDACEPFLRGGGQEKGLRSGTEKKASDADRTKDFVEKLAALPGCTIVPPGRLEKPELFSPYVVQAAFNNIPGNVMLRALDAKGFSISTGSACSAKKNKRPVLEAMHVDPKLRENAVRFSFGPHTTDKAVDELLTAVTEINSQFNR